MCWSRGLEAEVSDAFAYLRGLPDASLGGIPRHADRWAEQPCTLTAMHASQALVETVERVERFHGEDHRFLS